MPVGQGYSNGMESRASEHGQPAAEPAAEAPERTAGVAGDVAQVLALQRTIGNRRTAALVSGSSQRRISLLEILGPPNNGQAVHETLTLLAVEQAKKELADKGADPAELMSEFKRGRCRTRTRGRIGPRLRPQSHAQRPQHDVGGRSRGAAVRQPADTNNYSSAQSGSRT